MSKQTIKRFSVYFIGMVLLAFGLVLNTKTGLGASPLVAIAFCLSELTTLPFANVTFLMYCLFVLIEIMLHLMRRQRAAAAACLLQLPFSLVFTRFMSLFDACLPTFAVDCAGTFWGLVWVRVALLLAAIVLIGLGASLSVNMRLIPNPGDGCVLSIADFTGKGIGAVKNAFDIANVAVACAIGLIARGRLLGVGIGTVLAMLGVGRVMGAITRRLSLHFATLAPDK